MTLSNGVLKRKRRAIPPCQREDCAKPANRVKWEGGVRKVYCEDWHPQEARTK